MIPAGLLVVSQSCLPCHAAIVQTYRTTPMARSSGRATEARLPEGGFVHGRSGARYRVREDGMEFTKEEVQGARKWHAFVGAGLLARSFLWEKNGFLFELPVTFYAQPGRWDLSPGYEHYETVALNRPIEPECLWCHAGGLQHVSGTQNQYREPPFTESGIGCERCHGPGGKHVEGGGTPPMVQPARLDPLRRDSVCAQCHLAGVFRIARPGRSAATFGPGDILTDHTVPLVWESSTAASGASHFEQLWRSKCKVASGQRLWCGSCHDAHSTPAAAQRAAFFRRKCLQCHEAGACTEADAERERRGDACAACHLPKAAAPEIAHSAYSDHSIPRRPSLRSPAAATALQPFWKDSAGPRELGLAYAKLAVKQGNPEHYERAFQLLRRLETVTGEDAEYYLYLAFLYDRRGDESRALALYERTLRLDPSKVEAGVNAGSILWKRGDGVRARYLWEDALRRNPGLSTASLNLAALHAAEGRREEAARVLREAREYVPDLRAP
jgi:hypothetical protein